VRTERGLGRFRQMDRRVCESYLGYAALALGKLPRARNNDGTWRAKRSDAGKPRSK